MNARQLFRKQHPESRQAEVKGLRQELQERGFDDKQINLILQRRAMLVRVVPNTDINLQYSDYAEEK